MSPPQLSDPLAGADGVWDLVLAGLFPSDVRFVVASPDDREPPVMDEERSAVRLAVPKRRREFALGRACARRALEGLGVAVRPIGVGPGREPLWPVGTVGSITHCDGFVGAAVARQGALVSIGFDAEPAVPLEPDLERLICTEAERSWITVLPNTVAGWPKTVFSAKESVHKCIYPLCRVTLDFRDVELAFAPAHGTFVARLKNDTVEGIPDFARLAGRYVVTPTHVVTSAFLYKPRSAEAPTLPEEGILRQRPESSET